MTTTTGSAPAHTDHAACAAAVRSRDTRFDGCFFTAVLTTGIYCRPSCPAMTPREHNMTFYPTAAAAQGAGFRACKRCRPDATPGSPEWHLRGDVVARAMRLVDDGIVEREGVPGLAARLGYSTRQLQRLTVAELGAAPLALARAKRAQTARVLIETTGMSMSDIAFAAGFSSIRSFNDTIQAVFASSPGKLRAQAQRGGSGGDHLGDRVAGRAGQVRGHTSAGDVRADDPTGKACREGTAPAPVEIRLRLPFRAPLHMPSLFGHLAATAVPGVEEWAAGSWHTTLRLPHGQGTAHLRPPATTSTGPGAIEATLRLTDLRDLTAAIGRCRRLLDLDADPIAVDAHLGADPALAPLVARTPGVRIPGGADPHELALRIVLGQQISTAGAATLGARLVTTLGEALPETLRIGRLTHSFPTADAVAGASDDDLPGMPRSRSRALRTLAGALAEGSLVLDAGADREATRETLLALPGIGPWTTEMVLLRALGDPDAWPGSDLGVKLGAAAAGLPDAPRQLDTRAETWRPWRGYAAALLWAHGEHDASGRHLHLTDTQTPPAIART
ncbi:AlkA N-terminal domain-containing protein [Ornithinimicrobium sp. Y1847]|uniref:AlkA N-terminal domain-containing protein n=1 Tax=Ornithinimicrobium sp. Y1847 TaxID=3405419 RepID=UPI003B67C9D4